MPNKPTASNPTVRVPKRSFVQDMAEQQGFQRVIDENGNPMLLKPADPADTQPSPFDYVPKKKAKVVGPNPQVAAARG